jgi:HSP20 family protein
MMMRFDFPKTMNDLLEDSLTAGSFPSTRNYPAMDIAERENEYVAIAELPGVKKEDVKITFENDLLTVQGERKPYAIPEETRVLLNEMRVRKFNRSIRIPVGIDVNGISAELENGILRIVLPKSQEARVRTIAIK